MLQKEYERAKPLLEEWLAIVERTLGKQHAERAEILVRAGQVCEALGSQKKAEALLQQAVNIRHSVFGTEHPTFAVTLAELLRVEEKPDQAAELYDFVVVSLEKNLAEDDPLFIPIFENYSKVLSAIGDTEKSVIFETRAMVMRVEHGLDFGSSE
jgi:tetratricopeptide (TPR) repeat protein